jgi:tRNA dimethylallyltransferase
MSGPLSASARRHELYCLAGPTASGKSAVAVALALRLNAEIVSVDSMQVYRELDLGTAKPDAVVRAQVPHHLVDVIGLDETFDAARFVELAERVVGEIRGRARQPLLCGGTGLYFKAFLKGLSAAPAAAPLVRAALEALSTDELLAELAARDPVTMAAIDQKNRRRLVRALEVCRLTGRPYSSLRTAWSAPAADAGAAESGNGPRIFALRRAPGDLRQRIDLRVDDMFARGLVEETRRLLDKLEKNPTAAQALGYRQVIKHLCGEQSLAATMEEVKTRTWQYARRQSTWFRRQHVVEWIECGADDTAEQIAEMIGSRLQSK